LAPRDLKIMRGELRRAGRDDLFAKTRNICTMRAFSKAFNARWTKLADALDHFGLELNGAHDLGACPEPAVYGSKRREEVAN
jgi:hypothetical protein